MMEAQEFERSEAGFGWVINHLPTILWQRKYYVIALFGALTLAAVIAAYSLPTLYRSSATLLIESQELPKTVVDAPATGEIVARIAKIRERVLSRGDLGPLWVSYLRGLRYVGTKQPHGGDRRLQWLERERARHGATAALLQQVRAHQHRQRQQREQDQR